nr:hypothetical protein [uncultured Draconibacterium sp.]
MFNFVFPTLQNDRPTHVGRDKCNVGNDSDGVGRLLFDVGRPIIGVGTVIFDVGAHFFGVGRLKSIGGRIFSSCEGSTPTAEFFTLPTSIYISFDYIYNAKTKNK